MISRDPVGIDFAFQPLRQSFMNLFDVFAVDLPTPYLGPFCEWSILDAVENFVFENRDGKGVREVVSRVFRTFDLSWDLGRLLG